MTKHKTESEALFEALCRAAGIGFESIPCRRDERTADHAGSGRRSSSSGSPIDDDRVVGYLDELSNLRDFVTSVAGWLDALP